MADVTTFKTEQRFVPNSECRIASVIEYTLSTASDSLDNGDNLAVFDFPVDGRVIDAWMVVGTGLGTSTQLQLQTYDGSTDTNLTDKSSANTAETERMASGTPRGPVKVNKGDTLQAELTGGDQTAASDITIGVLFARS